MAFFKPDTLGDAVQDLLDREKRALLNGNIDALSRLVAEKTRLMKQMRAHGISGRNIDIIREKARHNRRLLDAVEVAIRSVGEQLRMGDDQAVTLQTYGVDGTSHRIGRPPQGNLEKRA